MDDLARDWRLLLIALFLLALLACSPARGEPVGVSNGGSGHHREVAAVAPPAASALAGLPSDFRTSFRLVAKAVRSEHGGLSADVYENGGTCWAEDLSDHDAGLGVYLIEHRDAGVRFAIADARGAAVADDASDAGASLEACARCHAGASGAIFPIVP